jgi:hypothetical protein
MSRIIISRVVLLTALGLAAWPASAEEPAGRYSVLPSSDGFIRVDTATGAVSHCGKRDGAWYCDVLIEDRGLIERRLDALTSQVAALAQQIAGSRCASRRRSPPRRWRSRRPSGASPTASCTSSSCWCAG